jgi:DNA-binding CsgD family transcriptional regulator/tetratricopeptide (TPR) repeat protein
VRARHAAHFASLAAAAVPAWGGPEETAWFDRLEAEHADLEAALRWWLERGDAAHGLPMAFALTHYWLGRAHWTEGRAWLTAFLALPGATAGGPRSALRARALWAAGVLAHNQGDAPAAQALFDEALALARTAGDVPTAARALLLLGNLRARLGDAAAARACYEESERLWRGLGDERMVAGLRRALAGLAHQAGDLETARALYEADAAFQRAAGNRRTVAWALHDLGRVAHDQGDHAAARARYAESLALRREVGDEAGVAQSLLGLGLVAHDQGDAAAAAHLRRSLEGRRRLGDRAGIADVLEALAAVAAGRDPARALRLAAAAAALRTPPGPPGAGAAWATRLAVGVDEAKRVLGAQAAAAAWAHGAGLTLEQALAEALADDEAPPQARRPATGGPRRRPTTSGEAAQLTPREREVAAFIARGRTSRQIAAALIITERTATSHVQHIRTKLGVRSRAQIAVWVAENGLLASPVSPADRAARSPRRARPGRRPQRSRSSRSGRVRRLDRVALTARARRWQRPDPRSRPSTFRAAAAAVRSLDV